LKPIETKGSQKKTKEINRNKLKPREVKKQKEIKGKREEKKE